MAKRHAVWVVSWNGESWACARAAPTGGAEVFAIEEAFAVPGEASLLPARVRDAIEPARRESVVFVDATVPLMVREVTVPLVAEDKQAATIAGEVHRAVPFAPQEISWDAVALEEDAIEQRLLLLAVRTADWMAARRAVDSVAPGRRSETLPIALLNVWSRLEPQAGSAAVVALPFRDTSLLLFTGAGAPRIRMVRAGLGDGGREALHRLRGEWTRAIAAQRRQLTTWQPEALWLLGGGTASFASQLEPVGGLRPESWRIDGAGSSLPIGGMDRLEADHQVAVAGALLAASGQPYHASHLLTEAERAQVAGGTFDRWLWAAAALFLAAGLVAWWPAWQRHEDLTSQRESLRAKATPVEAHAAEMDRLLADIAGEESAITGIADLARSRANWTRFLVDLQGRLDAVENVWIDALEVLRESAPEDGAEPVFDEFAEPGDLAAESTAAPAPALRLRLGGRLLDPAHPLQRVSAEMRARVNDLIDGLAGSDYVLDVADKRFDPLDGGLLRFTFTLTINPERRL